MGQEPWSGTALAGGVVTGTRSHGIEGGTATGDGTGIFTAGPTLPARNDQLEPFQVHV